MALEKAARFWSAVSPLPLWLSGTHARCLLRLRLSTAKLGLHEPTPHALAACSPSSTFEKSYLARLNYVHQNPVHHRLVPVANQYPWCSAAWFERTGSPAIVKSIYKFKIDQVKVYDEFEPAADW